MAKVDEVALAAWDADPENAIGVREAAEIAAEVALAMEAAHEQQ